MIGITMWNGILLVNQYLNPGGGGGGTSIIEGDRDVPLDRVRFCRSLILAQGI